MGEKYRPATGDRVRVVLEGEVSHTTVDNGFDLRGPRPSETGANLFKGAPIVSVEKVELPVETFKPGDVVRSKINPEYHYVILKDGDYANIHGSVYPRQDDEFTSKDYELVMGGYRP